MGTKISKAKIKKAIKGSLGIISTVAQKAGVDRRTIYKYLDKYPELWNDLHTERDIILDRAESVLFEKVNNKDWKAVEFTLNKLGGQRGYVNRDVIENNITAKQVDGDSFAKAWDKAKKDLSKEKQQDDDN